MPRDVNRGYGAPQVSTNGGGRTPEWSSDGKRLFFHDTVSNGLFVVDVHAQQQGLTFGTPVRLPIEAPFIRSSSATTT